MSGFVRFYTEGLLYKAGFEDGDILGDLFLEHNIPEAISEHVVLRRVVRELVAPRIKNIVELCDLQTIHNPIRALTVDGVHVKWHEDHNATLDPEYVDVPVDEILRIVHEVAVV